VHSRAPDLKLMIAPIMQLNHNNHHHYCPTYFDENGGTIARGTAQAYVEAIRDTIEQRSRAIERWVRVDRVHRTRGGEIITLRREIRIMVTRNDNSSNPLALNNIFQAYGGRRVTPRFCNNKVFYLSLRATQTLNIVQPTAGVVTQPMGLTPPMLRR
jgi:hypothetical protein